MKKVILLLSIAVISSCQSYDKNYTIFELWVGETKVTTRNQDDILGDGTVSYKGDCNSGVLTLNNASIGDHEVPNSEAAIISEIPNLTIRLVGNNSIGMGGKTNVNGIYTCNLKIEGDGSLAVCARASCIKADSLTIVSGKIDTYVQTPDHEIASYLGIGLWTQDVMTILGGDITVHYLSSFSPLSYGLYSVGDININGGSITISPEDSQLLAVGLISSETLTISGGEHSIYGIDDAINSRHFLMTGGSVDAKALDFSADAVCRLVMSAQFSGGDMTITALDKTDPSIPVLFSRDLKTEGMKTNGELTDSCMRIIKED
jgi:hypothetical protein